MGRFPLLAPVRVAAVLGLSGPLPAQAFNVEKFSIRGG